MTPEFRVWDKANKVYDVPTQINIDDSGHISVVETYHGSLVDGDFVLEQYTGLKDVNGNKIFEGDIVRNEHEKTCVVNFKEGSFLVGDFYFGSIGAGMGLEIIGNIHENPELLEVEK